MKTNFLMHHEYKKYFEMLSAEDTKRVLMAIFDYSESGAEPDLEGAAQMLFAVMQTRIEKEASNYEEVCEKRRAAGASGGKQKAANASKSKQKVANAGKCKQKVANAGDNDSDSDNDSEYITPPIAPPGGEKKLSPLSKTQTARFKLFWDAYPRKENKGAAERAWKKISPDDTLTQTIVEAVARAQKMDSRFREKQYIPHPSSWLNGRGWEDEYDTGRSPPEPVEEEDFVTMVFGGR